MKTENELIHAIEHAFDPAKVGEFIGELDAHGLRVSMFSDVCGSLKEYLPGSAFKKGDNFLNGFLEAYRALDETARGRVDSRYRTAFETVPDSIKRGHPRVFQQTAGGS
jgi:hypothetical protein